MIFAIIVSMRARNIHSMASCVPWHCIFFFLNNQFKKVWDPVASSPKSVSTALRMATLDRGSSLQEENRTIQSCRILGHIRCFLPRGSISIRRGRQDETGGVSLRSFFPLLFNEITAQGHSLIHQLIVVHGLPEVHLSWRCGWRWGVKSETIRSMRYVKF